MDLMFFLSRLENVRSHTSACMFLDLERCICMGGKKMRFGGVTKNSMFYARNTL
jgi:hypothetical protein